jgi:threonine/homoserine/homoserine lactone efflux protein
MAGIDLTAEQMTAAAPFLSTYLIMIVTPDPIDLVIVSLATLGGLNRALPMILGIAAGTAVIAGAALVAGDSLASMLPEHLMDVIAAAAMLFLAARIACSNPVDDPSPLPAIRQHRLVTAGFLISIFDPMLAAFLLAEFAGSLRFIVSEGAGWAIVLAVAIIDLVWLSAIACLMARSQLRRAMRNLHAPIRIGAAAVLAGLVLVKLIAILHLA